MDDAHLRSISVELQIAIVNVNYRSVNINGCVSFGLTNVHRHAPEYTFPASIEDCYTALKWVCNDSVFQRLADVTEYTDSSGR